LFFSEYVEGSSSYKALEIQAREASTLSGCRLVTYFNGASSGSGIALDGALAKGAVTTLCSTSLAALVGAPCARATNLTFNGDDAVALECGGALLDVIGQIGADPGDAWSSGDASTLNQTLRRRCSALSGDPNGTDGFDPTVEWTALPVDTFDGLGVAECPSG
jgi:predicted extracellular nuclease